ncbi:hypothetical protein D3C87_778360 [compost metagenome]|jgi:hypothetical protein
MMNEIFAQCIPYNNLFRGRIGGNPPLAIEQLVPKEYKFYATLIHPEKNDTMISILIHGDFDTLIDNNIYPSVAIQVIEHAYSEEGANEDSCLFQLGKHSISEYRDKQIGDFLFVKAGGLPRLIQYSKFYYEQLEKDGYTFFLQIEEEGYLELSEYVFAYGSLYLYKHSSTGRIIPGFWQFS